MQRKSKETKEFMVYFDMAFPWVATKRYFSKEEAGKGEMSTLICSLAKCFSSRNDFQFSWWSKKSKCLPQHSFL